MNNELHHLLVVSFAEATQYSVVLGIVPVEAQPVEQSLDEQTGRCIIEFQIVLHPLQHLIPRQWDVSADVSVAHCRHAIEWLLLSDTPLLLLLLLLLLIIPIPPFPFDDDLMLLLLLLMMLIIPIPPSSFDDDLMLLLLLIIPIPPSPFGVACLPSQPSFTMLSRLLHCAMSQEL